jgi:hypothetical protein
MGIGVFFPVEIVFLIKAKLCTVYISRLGIIEAVIAKSGIASFCDKASIGRCRLCQA